MPASRRPIDAFAAGTMVLLCAIWGAQQVVIKLAAPDVAPLLQVTVRSGLSALLVAALELARARRLPVRRSTVRAGLAAGALFGVEFLFIGEGLRRTSASHMVVFLYTAPVFAALGLHLLVPGERLRRHQWGGVAVAFGGIAVAFLGGRAPGGAGAALAGDVLAVLAGAAWGATTVVVRTTALSEAPATETLFWQLATGFALLLAASLALGAGAHAALTPVAVASLVFQGVVVSFASYLAWFWLLRRYLATRLSVFSFLTPIFGVAFGVLVLGEPVTPAFGLGAVLVLAGITIVSGAGRARGARRAEAPPIRSVD
ncbi:MAG TPA: DMT family transporter [Anaeromyxobacter sp.]|nr:DMT family transporter [Anaeromyxobacter sp.]